jgi:hypothetical protein
MTNLFTGLARCACCGEPMYLYHHGMIARPNGRKQFHAGYLRCSSSKRAKGCDNVASIPYAEFERQ